jgi:exopolyphosphatase / guanosine-5'-triphosphate,3'-diphosphate pyrophosphatase
LGIALRLAYTLSAGTKDLLAGTRLRIRDNQLLLLLRENSGVFAGESVIRRLGGLAQTLGLEAAAETDLAHATA